ncbi:MAG TPA: beta-mannosidase, partial [Chitinophagaceae bacterium]|nr:beta-mannosidase [Chitinophagaceae bacterium]
MAQQYTETKSKWREKKMITVHRYIIVTLVFLLTIFFADAQKKAVFNINTAQQRKPISPFIYGTNDPYGFAGSKRLGGNRLTNYNWENNASNAGRDWYHESDNYVPWQQGVPDQEYDSAGAAIKYFHQRSLQQGAYSLVTLPLAGYVARDKNGAIAESQSAPSNRWTSVEFRKPQELLPFRLRPDLTDNKLYVDELLNYLLHHFGTSSTSTGIRGYSLDNEPGLWFDTHSRLWGHTPVTVKYLMEKSIGLSTLIKEMDPNAEVFGPASWGITEFENLQFAPDWDQEKGNYPTFIDLYLGRMREKHVETGKRLLDVLDVHWYPQGNNNGISPFNNGTDYETNRVRMEMTRSLWDSTYIENTWIGNDPFKVQQFLPFIPKMHKHIDNYYPGTKLGITEYAYMGTGHASGGIAQADALGIFGKQGLYFANYWGAVVDFVKSGFDLYRNYDGKGGKFGSTSVLSNTNDINATSVHASIEGESDSIVHVVALNKSQDSAITVTIQVNSSRQYRSAKVYAFDNGSPVLRQLK